MSKQKTCFEFGGANFFTGAKTKSLIQLDQDQNKRGLFTVTYGLQQKAGLTYGQASRELGECLMHHAACNGDLNNQGE